MWGYLIPAALVLGMIATLLGYDLYKNIKATPPRRKK